VAQNSTDETVAALEREWQDWQIWVVHRYIGGPVWCARRWDGTGQTINAYSPAGLAEYLQELRGSDPAGPDADPGQF
jgi:hypothetical protein